MDGALGGRPGLPVRSHPSPRRGLCDRYPAAHRQRLAPRRPRLLVYAYRCDRPLPADARQGRVLSDGLGRQRPADRAPRPELLRRALRSVAAVRARLQGAGYAAEAADLGLASELHRALREADRRRREGLRIAVALRRTLGRLGLDLRHHRPFRAEDLAARVPAPAREGPGVSVGSADAVGCGFQDGGGAGGAGGSRAAGRVSPHPVRAHRRQG